MYLRPTNNHHYQSFSTFQNENNCKVASNQQSQAVKIKLERHQHLLSDIIKQLKQKVSKSQFLSGLGSKISLSDITNISFDSNNRDDSLRMQQSFCRVTHEFQEKLAKQKKYMQEQLLSIRQYVSQQQKIMKEQFQKQNKELKTSIEQIKTLAKQQNQGLLQLQQKKGDRSQLDKIMHLTSLLAIEFQLIKKRFSNFQVDYNLVWKEISNIYSAQQGIKSVLDTEQKNQSFNHTIERDLLRPLKKRRNSACVATLFKQLIGTVQRQQKQIEQLDQNRVDCLQKLMRQIQHLKSQQENRNYSLNIFNDKLVSIEERNGNIEQSLAQISKIKKQFEAAKKDIQSIYQDYQEWKIQTKDLTKIQITKQLESNNHEIKSQIKEACQQLSRKLLKFFDQCAKNQETRQIREHIRLFQRKFVQKTDHLQYFSKKMQEDFTLKSDYLDDKIKIIQKDLSLRLKTAQFQTQKSCLVTIKEANNLIKKVECSFKKDLQTYQQQQKEINEVLCSENVVARWIWTTGELKGGNLVAWDKQIINTLPQNFLHLKNEYAIKIKNTGIYRFQIGFYAKKKPNIQIIVNGQTIISAVNSNSYVVHHSSGRLKDISTTEVTGLTYYDFFTFQEDSRISIAYNGEIGHGFLSLQRL